MAFLLFSYKHLCTVAFRIRGKGLFYTGGFENVTPAYELRTLHFTKNWLGGPRELDLQKRLKTQHV